MDWRQRAVLSYSSIFASLLIVACASTPPVFQHRFSQEFFSSRDGRLRYRTPDGWLDATREASLSNNLVWLVRNDYAATLSVREVVLDAETRHEVNRAGLGRVAELTLALVSGQEGLTVVTQPWLSTLYGTKVCVYEYLKGHPNDLNRVVLVDTGSRVYDVTLLMTSGVGEKYIPEGVALQDAFVRNVLW